MKDEAVRAFAAVAVHEPPVVAALRAATTSLGDVRGVKWVRPDQLHFTLKFLGEVPADRVPAARRALGAAVSGLWAFDLFLSGLGAFPPGGPPRVVWAGCGEGREALEALAARVDAEMAAEGFPAESRPFAAHLTLGRVKDPRAARGLRERLAARDAGAFGRVRVAEVVLFRSRLSPAGPSYEPIGSFPLAG
ncbi:MAG: RNA 2',3'-cyclic phosphodiesterase [Acidobacteria bacterium]|nr:MAG: RNA 2',3'-cyclic phosphodiesterase [Acidobacteriota bacterium]